MFAQLINRINRTDSPRTDDADARPVASAGALFESVGDDLTVAQRDFIHLAIDWVDAPLGFFDRDLILRFANAAYCALLDHDRERLIGRPVDEVSLDGQDDEPDEGARDHARRALAGESLDIDIAHRHHGAIGDIGRLQYRPQRDAQGFVIGVLCVLHRLGRRRADQDDLFEPTESTVLQLNSSVVHAPMRAALRIAQDDVVERERKQRELIEGLPLPLMFVGTDGLCKWVNRAFCDAFGIVEQRIVGKAPGSLSTTFADVSRTGIAQAAAGQSHSIEQGLAVDDRATRWYRAEFLPGCDRENVRNGVYVLLTDIDEARRERQRLLDSEARFRGFLESVPETVVYVDRDGMLRYVNEGFVERSGKTRDGLIDRSIGDALGRDIDIRFRESLTRAFAGESFVREGNGVFGDLTEWREVRYLPIRSAAGQVEGVYVVSRSLERRMQAERAVRERDERIHFLTDNLPAQICYVDCDLRFEYCNQRFLSDYGFATVSDVIGRTPADIVGEEHIGESRRHADAALRGEHVTFERPAYRSPGRWMRVSLVGDFAADGTPRGIYSIAYDITDSKLAETARSRQQQWVESFIEDFPQPLTYLDPAGRHLYSNRAYEDFVGRPKGDVIGRTGTAVFGRDVVRLFTPSFDRGIAGERLHTEHLVPAPKGGDRILAADWMPDLDAAGETRGVYVVMQDVSEAKRARLAYEESLREMQRAMDSVALPISFVDTEERLRFVNHTTTTWYGRSAVDLIGLPMRELMSTDDYQFAEPYIHAALRGESVQYEREMRYHDGARRWVLIRYVSTRDEHGAVTGFYTTATDIQSRKKQEIALQQANGLLTAHFENTPLASFTLDGDGRLTRWSSQAETLFGWRRDEVLERPFADSASSRPSGWPTSCPARATRTPSSATPACTSCRRASATARRCPASGTSRRCATASVGSRRRSR